MKAVIIENKQNQCAFEKHKKMALTTLPLPIYTQVSSFGNNEPLMIVPVTCTVETADVLVPIQMYLKVPSPSHHNRH